MRSSLPPTALLLALLLCACAGAALRPAAPAFRTLEFALLEDYDKNEPLARVAEDFRIMKQLGIRTWRGSFGWDDYEPVAGFYDLEWLREFVALAEREGIVLRPYLAYTPEWAAVGGSDDQAWNDPPRDLDAWQRFVHTIATTFRTSPAVLSYEIYNEENAALWWDGTVAEYAATLERAAAAVRAADPDAQVVLGGFTYPDVLWLEALCETYGQAASFDVAAFHAYPETWSEPGVTVENYLEQDYRDDFLGTLAGGCAGQPVWLNEAGFATTPGRSEQEQAAWWARAIATFAAEPTITQIGVYEMRDLPGHSPVIGDEPNYYLGLRRVDGTPKLAFHTVRLLAQLLGGPIAVLTPPPHADTEAAADSAENAGVRVELFARPDRQHVLIAWAPGQEAAVLHMPLPPGARRGMEYDLRGDSAAVQLPEGTPLDLALRPGQVRIFRFGPQR